MDGCASCCSLDADLISAHKSAEICQWEWLAQRGTESDCVSVAIDLSRQKPWTGLEEQWLWEKKQNFIFLCNKKISKILPKPTLNKLKGEGAVTAEREA